MNHLLKSIAVLAIFGFLAAFVSLERVNASTEIQPLKNKPEFLTSLGAFQSGAGQLTAYWTSNCASPPYLVSIFDQTTGVFIKFQVPVNVTTYTLGGLTVGHTYLVNVQDCDSVFGVPVTIRY